MKPLIIPKHNKNTFHTRDVIGDTDISIWNFNGIKIYYFESLGNTPAALVYECAPAEITMCFSLQGSALLTFGKQSTGYELLGNQHNTFFCKEADWQLQFKESPYRLFVIKLPAIQYFEIFSAASSILQSFNANISLQPTATLCDQNSNIDFLLQTCIHSVLNCKYESSLKSIFMFSKVVEIMVLQVDSCKKIAGSGKEYIKTAYDKERILYAKEYLLKNIEHPPSLKQLSRAAGINEFKLKKGFKELFGQTVYDYLSDIRLDIGRNELLENKKSISQIAFDLGYSSLQHFSNAFKRKFGVSPKQYR